MSKYFYSYVISPIEDLTTFHKFGNGIYETDGKFDPVAVQQELNTKGPRRRTKYDHVENPDNLPIIKSGCTLVILYYSKCSE